MLLLPINPVIKNNHAVKTSTTILPNSTNNASEISEKIMAETTSTRVAVLVVATVEIVHSRAVVREEDTMVLINAAAQDHHADIRSETIIVNSGIPVDDHELLFRKCKDLDRATNRVMQPFSHKICFTKHLLTSTKGLSVFKNLKAYTQMNYLLITTYPYIISILKALILCFPYSEYYLLAKSFT
jgi:hypothetical protein